MIIEENNLSVAWGKAFLEVFNATGGKISPLVVAINDLENAEPPEIPAIRDVLDAMLKEKKNGLSCHEVANTIFPVSLWNPEMSMECLYERYLKTFPHIRKHPRNQYGVYFQRLISFGYDKENAEKRRKPVGTHHQHMGAWQSSQERHCRLPFLIHIRTTLTSDNEDFPACSRWRSQI